jgi:hypothetical protein
VATFKWYTACFAKDGIAYHSLHADPVGTSYQPVIQFATGSTWMCFPQLIYPAKTDLPTRRREIELFPELRRDNPKR